MVRDGKGLAAPADLAELSTQFSELREDLAKLTHSVASIAERRGRQMAFRLRSAHHGCDWCRPAAHPSPAPPPWSIPKDHGCRARRRRSPVPAAPRNSSAEGQPAVPTLPPRPQSRAAGPTGQRFAASDDGSWGAPSICGNTTRHSASKPRICAKAGAARPGTATNTAAAVLGCFSPS